MKPSPNQHPPSPIHFRHSRFTAGGSKPWRWPAHLAVILCAASLAACGGGGGGSSSFSMPTANEAPPSRPAAPPDNTVSGPAAPTSPWTTLGTRKTLSAPERTITRNSGATWSDYNPPVDYPKTVTEKTQYITMPDGIQLAAYVTLPADANGNPVSKPLPTILIQTSYNGGDNQYTGSVGAGLGAADPYMVEHGYATVVVDVRGTGQSQGKWHSFGPTEQSDYKTVVNWVARQPFSNGAIGVYGVSYLGITAVLTASQDLPAVKAAFPIVPIGDGYRDITFTGGQVNGTFIPLWLGLVTGLGLTDPTALTDPTMGLPATLSHIEDAIQFQFPLIAESLFKSPGVAYDSAFWATRSPLEVDGNIKVPTFVVGGLHDLFQRSEPITYEEIKNHAPTKLLIGPWTHLQAATGAGLPADGVPPLNHIELRWFDQYLKGEQVGADTLPNVTQYVAGYGHYVTAGDWPNPQATAQRLYLRGDMSLSTKAPASSEQSHQFVNVPAEGLCSISASQWTAGALGFIPAPCFTDDNTTDQWDLNYQTAPMSSDYYINGPIEADLWISSSARDAEVSVRVDDVAPDGTAKALTNGLQTASMRAVDTARSRYLDNANGQPQMIQPWHPYTEVSQKPLIPGTATLVPVEIFPTSALIKKGHRLRISVGASNVAQGVPPIPTLLDMASSASTTLYDDSSHPSSVVLPVVPATRVSKGQS